MKTTSSILLCGITERGNLVALTETTGEKHLLNKAGEYSTGSHLQFPEWILKDKITADSAEAGLREYQAARIAAAAAEAAEKQAAEGKAAAAMKSRYGSLHYASIVLSRYEEQAIERAKYVEPTISALRAALKKAETAEAKKKEMAAWEKTCKKAVARLKAETQKPLKGKDHARCDFPAIGNNKKLAVLLAAIPNSHKEEIASRRQKGYFSWSAVISPEAMAAISKLLPLTEK